MAIVVPPPHVIDEATEYLSYLDALITDLKFEHDDTREYARYLDAVIDELKFDNEDIAKHGRYTDALLDDVNLDYWSEASIEYARFLGAVLDDLGFQYDDNTERARRLQIELDELLKENQSQEREIVRLDSTLLAYESRFLESVKQPSPPRPVMTPAENPPPHPLSPLLL